MPSARGCSGLVSAYQLRGVDLLEKHMVVGKADFVVLGSEGDGT